MSRQQRTQSFIEHTKWYEDGAKTPWIIPPDGVAPYTYDGKITTQCDTTDFDGTLGMADATVVALADAKKVIIKPPNGTPSIALRFRSDGSAGDDSIIQLYAASGVDHYQHLSQLTIVQGTQLYSGSIYFCDGVTPSDEKWYSTVTELTGTSDYIGGYVFNLHGNDRVLILANDRDTTTIYVDWKVIP